MNRVREFIKHVKKDPFVMLLHVGTGVSLIGFCSSDQLNIRVGSICSGLSAIAFNLTRDPKIIPPLYWSLAFMSTNMYHVSMIVAERRQYSLNKEELDIYEQHFKDSGMRPLQFKRLLENGTKKSFPAGYHFAQAGNPTRDKVWLLLSGEVQVSIEGVDVSTITASAQQCFIGEIHILEKSIGMHLDVVSAASKAKELLNASSTNNKNVLDFSEHPTNRTVHLHSANVTVDKNNPVVAIEWESNFILSLLSEKGSELASALHNVLLCSVLRKLKQNVIHHNKHVYMALIEACITSGEVSKIERKAVRTFMLNHSIDYSFHLACLQHQGWTEDDWNHGKKAHDNYISDWIVSESLNTLLMKATGNVSNSNSGNDNTTRNVNVNSSESAV